MSENKNNFSTVEKFVFVLMKIGLLTFHHKNWTLHLHGLDVSLKPKSEIIKKKTLELFLNIRRKMFIKMYLNFLVFSKVLQKAINKV